ncbi:FG-GAP-like repeat-containing protein [Arthrobacter sp. cf158]|uniref:FG-GAP-like repeat-containing protein n=1 Tax=Arthrobacter sp. cf158 TaxID=1761744 RepID=UPI001587D3BC|nr:FG-GAP-like repeat-containing protein [Arthrobacter sp. cf158]
MASMDSPDTLAVDASILKFSRDGSRAFVYGSQYFADIYAPADMVSGSVEVMNAFDLAMSPSGSTAYLPTSYETADVAVVDTVRHTVTARIPLAEEAQKVAISANGAVLYALSGRPYDSPLRNGVVSVIDLAAKAVKAVVPVGAGANDVLVAPSGDKIYVSNYADNTVTVISAATNKVVKTIPIEGGLGRGSISADGAKIFYPKPAGGIAVVGISMDTVLANIPTNSPVNAPVFTRDGSRAYFVDQYPGRIVNGENVPGDYSVSEIDLAKNTARAISTVDPGQGTPGRPVVQTSPDGKRLYVLGSKAVVLTLPSLQVLASTPMPRMVSSFTMSPDGSKGYGLTTGGGHIVVVNAPRLDNVRKDYNSDFATDILARDSGGALWLYPGNANKGWLTRTRAGSGWNGMNLVVTPGDFNGDLKPDVLARDNSGDLWLYPGDGQSYWWSPSKIGVGWNAMTAVFAPGDFDYDGHSDILARDGAGDLWLYPGNGMGGWLSRTKVGSGWNDMTAIMGPGRNANPGTDVLARDSAGTLWLYERDLSNRWVPRRQVGTGWNAMTSIVTPGDFDGDDIPDILARDFSGDFWLYPGTEHGGYQPGVRVGAGWNVMTAIA